MAMARRSSWRKWARVAGLGAVLPVVAQAHAAAPADSTVIRFDGDRLYVSEAGGAFQEFRLGETPEARALRGMLEQQGGAAEIRLGPTILAGSGGCGYHWTPVDGSAPPPPNPPPAKKR
jgi:hypothetical protein